jgi:GTP-binding protein
MIDRVKIYVKAGDGGKGCDSFKGKKFTRSRRPDGGNGGNGADVVMRGSSKKQSLEEYKYKQHIRAENGKNGGAGKKRGADGHCYIMDVPPGTIVRDLEDNLLLQDLQEPGAEFIVVRGGQGGRGNTRVKEATPGLPGEERHLLLELKLVTDIGIIGYPNVGKSALLARISSARPKIAAFPFTTTSPVLGTLKFSEFEEPSVLKVLEVPGLMKGADQGKGLGAQFLRHIERTGVLIHLIDMSAQEGRIPFDDYQSVNQELALYNQDLADKPQILVANKMDLPGAKSKLKDFSAKVKKDVYPISAATGEGIEELVNCLSNHFHTNKGSSDAEELTT